MQGACPDKCVCVVCGSHAPICCANLQCDANISHRDIPEFEKKNVAKRSNALAEMEPGWPEPGSEQLDQLCCYPRTISKAASGNTGAGPSLP